MAGPLAWQRQIVVERLSTFPKRASHATVARACGVAPSTLMRWLTRYPDLRSEVDERAKRVHEAWRLADEQRRAQEHAERAALAGIGGQRRPKVRYRRDCPECGADLLVRTAPISARTAHQPRGSRYWRCSRHPHCAWRSWRPPAPGECPRCQGALYWSCSHLSIGCDQCKFRVEVPLRPS